MLFEELVDYGLVKGAADVPATAPPVSVLPQLQQAKQHSDNRRYREKADILRRLMTARPRDWVVDQPGPHHPGITHQPTKFRFHTDRKAIPKTVKSAKVTKQAAILQPEGVAGAVHQLTVGSRPMTRRGFLQGMGAKTIIQGENLLTKPITEASRFGKIISHIAASPARVNSALTTAAKATDLAGNMLANPGITGLLSTFGRGVRRLALPAALVSGAAAAAPYIAQLLKVGESNAEKAFKSTPFQSPAAYLATLGRNFRKFQDSDAYMQRMRTAGNPVARLGQAVATLGGRSSVAPVDRIVEKFALDMNTLPTASTTNDWTAAMPAAEIAAGTAGLAAGGGTHLASGIGSVNPNSRKAMTDFMANVNPTSPARSFLHNYVHHGSNILGNVILDGTGGNPSRNGMDVMGAVYGKGLHPVAQTAVEYLNGKWDWKKDHYKQFASGALPAYMKITQEVFDDPGYKQWPHERVNNTLSELAKALVVSKDRTELANRLADSGFDAADGTLTNALKPMTLGGNFDKTYAKLRQAIGIPAAVDGAKSFDPVELMTNKLVKTLRTLGQQDPEFAGLDKIIRRTPVGGESRVSPAITQIYQRLSPAGQQRLLRTMVDDQDLLPSLVASRFKQYWKDAPSLYRGLMGNSMKAVDTIGSVKRMSGLLPSSMGLLAHGAASMLGSKPKIQLVAPRT